MPRCGVPVRVQRAERLVSEPLYADRHQSATPGQGTQPTGACRPRVLTRRHSYEAGQAKQVRRFNAGCESGGLETIAVDSRGLLFPRSILLPKQSVRSMQLPRRRRYSSAKRNRKSSSVRLWANLSSPSTSSASAALARWSCRIFCSILSFISRR